MDKIVHDDKTGHQMVWTEMCVPVTKYLQSGGPSRGHGNEELVSHQTHANALYHGR